MASPPLVRKIVFFVLMFIFSSISSLLLLEITLRVSGRGHAQDVHTASQEIIDDIPGMFEPGQDVIKLAIPQLPHRISINSLGYRGPEVRLNKYTLRILCIGDSFTFGDYVNDDETFPSILQNLFQGKSLRQVEVINGGVGGTTIVDQLYFLQKSMRIKPNLVVLTFYENDVTDLRSDVPMYLGLESNRKLKSKPVISTLYRLFRDTASFNLALELRARYRILQVERMAGEHAPNNSSQTCNENLWQAYEGHLKEMQMLLSRNSIKFMLVIYPSHHRWARPADGCGAFPNQPDRLEYLAKNMGIATLNLLPVLKQSSMDVRDLYLLPYDGHPTKEANKITANAIFGFLKENFPDVLVQTDMKEKNSRD